MRSRINQGAARARRPAVVGRGLSEGLGRTELDGAWLQAPKGRVLDELLERGAGRRSVLVWTRSARSAAPLTD